VRAFGRRRVTVDTSLFERVSGMDEVPLGTFGEAALMAVGYAGLEADTTVPDSLSPLARLDQQARNAAGQAALDELIANGTVDLTAGTSVTAARAAGRAGKLTVTGELGQICALTPVMRRARGVVLAELKVLGGSPDGPADGPAGGSAGGSAGVEAESCYAMPSGAGASTVVLVEHPDFAAGTITYTLRTLGAEFIRIADFLFADPPAAVHIDVSLILKTKGSVVRADHSLTRLPGEEHASGTMNVRGITAFGAPPRRKSDQTDVTRGKLVKGLLAQYLSVTQR
jgi:hypothetical protein